MIYLDNGATTMVCKEAADACVRSFENFGNPSSLHSLGLAAKNALKKCSGKIEKVLNAEDGTFYFTSGATEANNWAIFGAAEFNTKRGKHIITSKTEHPSVLEPVHALESRGFRVTRVCVDKRGCLDMDELLGAICDETVLVSIMAINNETGTINDITEIGNTIKKANKNTIFHVDGVAAFCKIPIDVNKYKIDLFSLSGHKLHSPKGIGGLYIRKGTRICPFIYGGGQQKNMRSGTESMPLIEALAASVEMCGNDMAISHEKVLMLKNRLRDGIQSFEGEVNGETEDRKASPYVLNVGFRGLKSQILINALEQRGIYAAAGSACTSNKKTQDGSLVAMGIDKELREGAVRFSFSRYNTEEEIDICLNALNDIYSKYRG